MYLRTHARHGGTVAAQWDDFLSLHVASMSGKQRGLGSIFLSWSPNPVVEGGRHTDLDWKSHCATLGKDATSVGLSFCPVRTRALRDECRSHRDAVFEV